MTGVDTNVLLYVHDSRAPGNQAVATQLLESLSDGVLLWQVACEYLAASRKLEVLGYERAAAWKDIRNLQRVWSTLLPAWSVTERCDKLLGKYKLSFWDAMIVAACLEGGLRRLYSEDFDAYSRIESLEIINPFKSS